MKTLSRLPFVHDDGGRAAADYVGSAGDCVTRAVAIATGLPYQQVYDAMAAGTAGERRTKRSGRLSGRKTAREGIHTSREWFKTFMRSLGWVWTPTMLIGSGCKVHLCAGELPTGRLIVAVSKHYTAVIDGVIRDTHDPQREVTWFTAPPGVAVASTSDPRMIVSVQRRCVYGYWMPATA